MSIQACNHLDGGERAGCFALLNLYSWCLVMVERLFLAVPRGCLRFVIVVFPDHTHLLFLLPMGLSFTEKSKSCVGKRPHISVLITIYL